MLTIILSIAAFVFLHFATDAAGMVIFLPTVALLSVFTGGSTPEQRGRASIIGVFLSATAGCVAAFLLVRLGFHWFNLSLPIWLLVAVALNQLAFNVQRVLRVSSAVEIDAQGQPLTVVNPQVWSRDIQREVLTGVGSLCGLAIFACLFLR